MLILGLRLLLRRRLTWTHPGMGEQLRAFPDSYLAQPAVDLTHQLYTGITTKNGINTWKLR
jgi:hypothetical protein